MNKKKLMSINTKITDTGFWHGIADSHDTFPFMLCELIDDSISSIAANDTCRKEIVITISECVEEGCANDLLVCVEDTGAGIKNLDDCLTYACTAGGETALNKYGVALKKVLATFDPANAYWKISTRSEAEYNEGTYRHITAPYRTEGMVAYIEEGANWPGELNGSGTYISFPCSYALMRTSGKGYPGRMTLLQDLLLCVGEELGVIYAPYLAHGLSITLKGLFLTGGLKVIHVHPIKPLWLPDPRYKADQGEIVLDLGQGDVRVKYRFGQIENHPDTKRYFQKNRENSGVMIYENGRMIEFNIFNAIWTKKEHNQYNSFLAIIELEAVSSNEALPPPCPTKDKLFHGDERLMALYQWILNHCPSPSDCISKKKTNQDELIMCKQLADQLRNQYGESATVRTQLALYSFIENNPPLLDIYLFTNEKVNLFECKKGRSHAKDLFQLLMYYFGAVHDGIHPNILILLAERHPKGVVQLAEYLNSAVVMDCKIVLQTWKEYGMGKAFVYRKRLSADE